MILRVEIDSISAALDLEGSAWTPELVGTFLRHLGDEALRLVLSLQKVDLAGIGSPGDESPDDESSNAEAP